MKHWHWNQDDREWQHVEPSGGCNSSYCSTEAERPDWQGPTFALIAP